MRRAAILAVAAAVLAAPPSLAQMQPEPRAVVWAVGDGADGTRAARRMARTIGADRPDRFLYLGDVYDHGTWRDFRLRYHPVYGRLAAITLPTPGNHEWANRRRGYYRYWRRRHGRRMRPWYARSIAGWELVSLNSEAAHGRSSSQVRWLRRVLRRRTGTCRLAFMHRPRFGAGTTYGDSPDLAPLWRALRGHARLVLSGHEHNMQRLRRREGLTQLISGAGGSRYYAVRRRDRRLAFGRRRGPGALRLVLRPGRASIEFRDARGRRLDSSTARCRPLEAASMAQRRRAAGG
jgi:hypothetical protein